MLRVPTRTMACAVPNADKRRAVVALLEDPEWSAWSDREIARRSGSHHKLEAASASSYMAQSAI